MNSNKLILRTTTWKGLEGRLNRRRLTLSLRSLDDDDDDDEDEDEDEDEDDNDDDEYSQITTTALDEFGRASTNYISAEKRSREIPSDIGEAKRLPVGGRNGNGGA
ncbi:hypothetical protein HZH68_002820 [Vespula germanica]|uniref:Uncharacterized protein n=1 Tax=Vespula germanica TaxID=30212 RepID=A0A834NN46_VESGE|nr:hypothetical protein HZH68_002820 [Vespula germanica]